jgi:hypothetical protein
MMLLVARLFADLAAALGHLTPTELALVAFELAIDFAALAFAGAIHRRPREAVEAASELEEAA